MASEHKISLDVPSAIDAPSLMAAATAQTGLSDFGDQIFVEPLTMFLASVQAEAGLSEQGLMVLQMDVTRLLANRLLLQAEFAAHPEISQENVDDPIIIVGLPRTGTTKLQRMMGATSLLQAIPLWRILFPGPMPIPSGGNDPRIAMAQGFQQQLSEQFPQFMAAHPMIVDEPEEEALLAQMSFERLGALDWFYRAPSYNHWLAERSTAPAYTLLKRLLQQMQWQDGGRKGRPWVLKTPLHTGNLDLLSEAFPKATIVHCHREPADVVPSFSGLVELIRVSRGHTVDRKELGQFMLEQLALRTRRHQEQRETLKSRLRIIDVDFKDIVKSAPAVVSRVLDCHGLSITPDAQARLVAWEQSNLADRFGQHVYSLEQYGLNCSEVNSAFADYRFLHLASGASA